MVLAAAGLVMLTKPCNALYLHGSVPGLNELSALEALALATTSPSEGWHEVALGQSTAFATFMSSAEFAQWSTKDFGSFNVPSGTVNDFNDGRIQGFGAILERREHFARSVSFSISNGRSQAYVIEVTREAGRPNHGLIRILTTSGTLLWTIPVENDQPSIGGLPPCQQIVVNGLFAAIAAGFMSGPAAPVGIAWALGGMAVAYAAAGCD